ncbi:O-acetyl-ADP-ribose deacetylase (regulator of RNase III) [Kitasatospora sp. GP30]|uniref:O-acetyl-ADP-ribose deacetylase n=1 Tax=Kitasatospora sp. GP30 TaxID=3035084 RepID=UPI000C708A4F|nr:O-acetyl-ADP-ribose deacetylase [Kitasatospora sp. GP30]MDH6138407.1 O-acetyl-ADP-ribose deacetylase (regulator of RNase III) [Kitasatospora sp. GP30]
MTQITLVQGDITKQRVDVVVNAANSSLLGGGGVDGAIHRAGGPEILAECRALRAGHYGKGLATGQAVATTAGKLPAGHVVHTVGPVYGAYEFEQGAELLASCYRQSLRLAVELGAASVAFPAISAGVYGWPMESAARVALSTVLAEAAGGAGGLAEVRFVLFGAEAYEAFERVRGELPGGPAGARG